MLTTNSRIPLRRQAVEEERESVQLRPAMGIWCV
jgi:hypothetical protein